ncbi:MULTISPECIES: MerR family transcriptional regulator [unclassified Clostridium]|uniref:MerR family transcriptional regulator n=1 Tax=unclassified Clostridium TaxID=2614128 RepID=UPI0025C2F089|nr:MULTISPECIES: MerR family transcriptional regulator [unclassified Clostridium]
MKSDDTFIDVLYCNDEDEFEPQFTMSQVTQELDARSSKITYWCKRYKLDALVERINNKKDRCFSIYEIKILRKIKSLKDKDLNSKKIEELIADDLEILKERKIKMAEETQKAEEMIQYNQNEQIVEMLASKLAEQFSNEMMNMKNSIVDELSVTITNNIQEQLSESFKTSSEATKEQLNVLEINLSSKIDNALEGQLDDLKHTMDEQEKKFIEKDLDRIELFKNSMDEHKKVQEDLQKELEKEKNKGFFKKLFNRKNEKLS